MNEISILIMALLAGISLGAIFYGGLWWTVRRSVASKTLSFWLLGSFVLRTSIAVGGFYLVSRDDWRSLLTCLLGFLIARIAVTHLIKRMPTPVPGPVPVPVEQKNRCAQGGGP
jgi:F1F0 ATPase subunit 2